MPPKNIYRSRKVVSCKYCFYEKNDECQLRVCPYVAERITAKVINYEKLILEFFKGNQPRLFSTRLRKHCRTYRHFSYLSTSHRKLFEQTRDEIARITYTPVCGADLAILYLSTSDELMSKHIIPLITHAKQLSWRFESNGSLNAKKYAIFKTAKQFTKGDFEINPQEFLSSEFVPDSTFSLIINALLLANYGTLAYRAGTGWIPLREWKRCASKHPLILKFMADGLTEGGAFVSLEVEPWEYDLLVRRTLERLNQNSSNSGGMKA